MASPVFADLPTPRVTVRDGSRVVVDGQGVTQWAPRMPIWCSDADHGGLLLFEATVASISGQTASLDVPDNQANRVRLNAFCEPRWVAEARQFHGHLPVTPTGLVTPNATGAPAQPQVRVRHRALTTAQWGKPIWLDGVLDGPAEKLFAYWRLGVSGPFTELPLAARGDNLFGADLTLPELETPPPVVQYYLVAVGPGGRSGVFANPAEPQEIRLESLPAHDAEQLVAHGPVDRASHHTPLEIRAQINKRFSNPIVFYRARGAGNYVSLPMLPVGGDAGKPVEWRAVIPARDVVAPGMAYYIAVMDDKGVVHDGFASARNPTPVSVVLPQILSAEENRNRLGFQYGYANFGSSNDYFHQGEVSLERFFFGFLIARLSAAGWWGVAPQRDAASTTGAITPQALRLYLGRAGLEFHLGDYVAIATDLDMATFHGGGGIGYRGLLHIGDEHVASIELSLEQVWNIDAQDLVLDIKRGTLLVPFGDQWRLAAHASQELVLADAPRAIRLGLGVEYDLGAHLQLALGGGLAGRRDSLGPSLAGGVKVKF